MKKIELFFTWILIPVDMIMLVLAFILAYKFRLYFGIVPTIYIEPIKDYMQFFILTLPGWLIIFTFNGLYSTSEKHAFINEFGKIFVAVSASVALILTYVFLSRMFFFSRFVIILMWALAIAMVVLGRLIVRLFQTLLYRYGIGVHRVIIIGQNSLTKPVVNAIKRNYRLGYKIVKLVDRHGVDKIETIVQNNPCDEIMITDTSIAESHADKILEFCREHGLGFKMTPNLFLVRSSHVSIQSLADVPILEFQRTPLDGWGKIIKRFFDLLISILLIIILSPIMLLVAIAVKITSKGPILFHQERVGLDHNFNFYKFRTMREGAAKEHAKMMKKYGVMFKLKNDPRLTPIGRFFKKNLA